MNIVALGFLRNIVFIILLYATEVLGQVELCDQLLAETTGRMLMSKFFKSFDEFVFVAADPGIFKLESTITIITYYPPTDDCWILADYPYALIEPIYRDYGIIFRTAILIRTSLDAMNILEMEFICEISVFGQVNTMKVTAWLQSEFGACNYRIVRQEWKDIRCEGATYNVNWLPIRPARVWDDGKEDFTVDWPVEGSEFPLFNTSYWWPNQTTSSIFISNSSSGSISFTSSNSTISDIGNSSNSTHSSSSTSSNGSNSTNGTSSAHSTSSSSSQGSSSSSTSSQGSSSSDPHSSSSTGPENSSSCSRFPPGFSALWPTNSDSCSSSEGECGPCRPIDPNRRRPFPRVPNIFRDRYRCRRGRNRVKVEGELKEEIERNMDRKYQDDYDDDESAYSMFIPRGLDAWSQLSLHIEHELKLLPRIPVPASPRTDDIDHLPSYFGEATKAETMPLVKYMRPMREDASEILEFN